MSKYSGKCDLYDHVYMIGCRGTTDDMTMKEKFDIFKKRTGGKLYQRVRIKLTKLNIDHELRNSDPKLFCKNDDGTYTYFFKTFKTLSQINKFGYSTTKIIYFDEMLDLVKYYPYVIASMGSDIDSEIIYLSLYSEVDSRYFDCKRLGLDLNCYDYYTKELNNAYREVVLYELENK